MGHTSVSYFRFRKGHVNIWVILLALWAWLFFRVLASCPKSDFLNLVLVKLWDPIALSRDYALLHQLLINQSSGLCHSASITAPPLFKSHSHNITGWTILIAKINFHHSLFLNKCWLFMYHYLATEYTVTYLALYLLQCYTGVHKSRSPSRPCDYVLYGGDWYLWILSLELASCHPSDAENFEVATRFLERFWTPDIVLN
jgi:hypothetical protein